MAIVKNPVRYLFVTRTASEGIDGCQSGHNGQLRVNDKLVQRAQNGRAHMNQISNSHQGC